MKKLAKLFMVALVALSLAACSSTDKPGGDDNGGDKVEGKTYEIGLAIYRYDDNFMTAYRNELLDYFGELGKEDGNTYNVEMVDGKNDQATQTEQIDNFITQGKDLIIANLVDPTGAENLFNKAKADDIPVVLINREPKSVDDMRIWPGKTTYVGADATQSGYFQGEMILNLEDGGDINGDGVISHWTLFGEPGNVDAAQRTEYSIKALDDAEVKHEAVAELVQANWATDEARAATADILGKVGDKLEVIFANNDGMAIGAIAAIEEAGLVPNKDIYVVGVDAVPEAMVLVNDGKLTGTVLNDHYNQAHTAADLAIKLLAGEEVAAYHWHDYVMVVDEDAAKLSRKDFKAETADEVEARYAQR